MTPPKFPDDIEQYDGKIATVSGMKMVLPPERNPFGDVDTVIMPFSILIDGEEILIQ